jgi:hypothetical protein
LLPEGNRNSAFPDARSGASRAQSSEMAASVSGRLSGLYIVVILTNAIDRNIT